MKEKCSLILKRFCYLLDNKFKDWVNSLEIYKFELF